MTNPAYSAPAEHAARALELVAEAEAIYRSLADRTGATTGIAPHLRPAYFAEMAAVASLAQVYATLATRTDPR